MSYTALRCCASSRVVYDIHPSFSVFNSDIKLYNSLLSEQAIGQNSDENADEIPDPMDEDFNQTNDETSDEFD